MSRPTVSSSLPAIHGHPRPRATRNLFLALVAACLLPLAAARAGDPPAADVATALGIPLGGVAATSLTTSSGKTPLKTSDSLAILPAEGRIVVTSGLAIDAGLGNTDLLADGAPDRTTFSVDLNVPPGANTLLIGTRFLTAEHAGRAPVAQADSASLSVGAATPLALGVVGPSPTFQPLRMRSIDVTGLTLVTLTFVVEDAIDGSDDSGIELSGFLFTEAVPVSASELAAALFPGQTVTSATLTVTSGTAEVIDPVSASVLPQGVRLTSGLATDEGLGSTDLLADGAPDRTELSVTLETPADSESLLYRSLFRSAEATSATPDGDTATIEFSGPTGLVPLGIADGTVTTFSTELRAGATTTPSMTVTIVVSDVVDGDEDSAIEVSHTAFTAAPIVTATEIANAIVPEGSLISASLEVESGMLDVIDVVSARTGTLPGSALLSTGTSDGAGLADTDLGLDDEPDLCRLSVTLAVPTDPVFRSLVYTTRFGSSEVGTGGMDFSSAISGGTTESTGSVGSSVTAQDPPVTHAFSVEGQTTVTVEFLVTDVDDLGHDDSGLLVSGLFFSEFEASLLENPRPADSNLKTGTYAYSKTMIGAIGTMMPFGVMVHYSSAPRRTSGTMGPNWGHSYDWKVIELSDGTYVVRRGDGSMESFEPDAADPTLLVPSYGQIFSKLIVNADDTFEYRTTNQVRFLFSAEGDLTSIVDENGNTSSVTQDGEGRVATVTDTRNQTATFTYTDGKLTGITYATQSVSFAYLGDDLASLTDPDGHTTSFTYDNDHHILVGTDATGVPFVSNTYDEFHRVTDQLDGKFAPSSTDFALETATHTDRVGNATVTTYDPLDRQTAMETPDGALWTYGYDANDNLTDTTDPLGVTSTMTFDERGNVLTETDGLGATASYTYDDENRPLSVTNELGHSISFVYNAEGNLAADFDALGVPQTYTYDERGLRTSVTDRRGSTTTFTFDEIGDMTHVTDPLGGVAQFTYDALGREIASTDANGNTSSMTVDGAGRTTSTTDALGSMTTMVYDDEGRLTAETDELGRTTTFEYSPTGRLTAITDALGNTVQSAYDGEDRLVSITDPRGDTTTVDYDPLGRIAGSTDPLGGSVSASYDLAGQRTQIIDPRGNATHFAYDELGRVVSETDALGNSTHNTYDAAGRLTSFTNARGQALNCGYDDASRLTSITRLDHTIDYTLDENGNRTVTTGPGGRTTLRSFDALDRPTSVTDVHGNTVGYQYDAVGNVTAITYSDGKVVSYTYDALDRMTSVTDWEGRQTTYVWDASGRLISSTLPDGSAVTYSYDGAGRLLGMHDVRPTGATTFQSTFTLDAAGLRIGETSDLPLEAPITGGSRSFTVDAANQIIAEGSDSFSYDADGNLTHGVVGRIPVDLEYDETNRLTSVGASAYEYDEDGLRIEATINHRTVRYVQDSNSGLPRVLEEHDEYGNITARYVYGLGLISRHEPIEPDDDAYDDDSSEYPSDGSTTPSSSPEPDPYPEPEPYPEPYPEPTERVSVYHFDSRGSTLALTNLSGEVTDRYAYDPYGLIVAREGRTSNPYTYNGRDGVIDDGNGLYFMRTRYYEPRLMRFISRDGLVAGSLDDSQSLNRTMYARGNPIQGVDPGGDWGLFDDAVAIVGGGIAGLGAQLVSDVITVIGGGEWSGWEEYVGAFVEGAVWGETLLYTGNPALAGAAGAAAGNATTQGLRIATGKQSSFDWQDFATDVAAGAAFGKFGKGAKSGKKYAKQLKKLKKTARAWRKSMGTNLEQSLKEQFKKQAKAFVKKRVKSKVKSAAKKTAKNVLKAKASAWAQENVVDGTLSPTGLFEWYGQQTSRKVQ